MTLALSLPPRRDSWLARLDPRWRIAGMLALLLVTALLRTLPGLLLAVAPALVLGVVARLPPRWVGERLGMLLLVLAPLTLPLPFLLTDGIPWWSWGPLALSRSGVVAALVVLLRATVLVTLTLVLLATASLETLLEASHALGVPGVLTHLALLTFRYLFVVADELARLRRALWVRGFRNRANHHSYRTVGQVAGTLLVRGAARAERVHQAMRCRGFDGTFRTLTTFRTKPADVLTFLLLVASAALLGWFDHVQS
jgi:cobalt/nickel transport system permease protein